MRLHARWIIFLSLLSPLPSLAAPPVEIGLPDVVRRVSEANYTVYENALRVYQAKTQIESARANLLPHLNLWGLLKIKLDPLSILDQITDIAPFLVPANWFRLEEVKLLYLAEREGYRALWGNELHSAKSLYTRILFDRDLQTLVQTSLGETERLHRIALTREAFGGAKPGTARKIEMQLLALQEDIRNLGTLIALESDQLTQALAYPADTSLTLRALPLPELEGATPILTADHEFRVLSTSPERRQFDHLLSALSQIKKEVEFSFLGSSDQSRGVAGGIFDGLPGGSGLGFGNGPSLRILAAQGEILSVRKLGVEEVLRRQLRAVAMRQDADIANFGGLKRRVALAREAKSALFRRMELGEEIELSELSEALLFGMQAETALLDVRYRVLVTLDRLDRLDFAGDYAMVPPVLETLPGVKP